jgi:hypothetical protein
MAKLKYKTQKAWFKIHKKKPTNKSSQKRNIKARKFNLISRYPSFLIKLESDQLKTKKALITNSNIRRRKQVECQILSIRKGKTQIIK